MLFPGKQAPPDSVRCLGRAVLVFVLLLALAVRLFALTSWQESLYSEVLSQDERVYHTWASTLVQGSPASPLTPEFTPLYAWVMVFVYRIFSIDILHIRILNIVFGAATCLLIALIANALDGQWTGVLSGIIAALYKPFIFFSIAAMKTSLSIFLFALSIVLFIASFKRPSSLRMLLLGAVMGLFAHVRANGVVLLGAVPLAFLVHHHRQEGIRKTAFTALVLYSAGVLASILPFAHRNIQISGSPAMAAAGGFNLYLGYQPGHASPYYRPAAFASSSVMQQGEGFVIEASRRLNRRLSIQEASRYWVDETARWAAANPGEFFRKTVLKTLALFNRFESADNYHIGFLGEAVPMLRWPFFEIWLLLPLGMAGVAATCRSGSAFRALHLVMALYAVTLVFFFTNVRIRLPLMVGLIPLAVIGVRIVLGHVFRKDATPGSGRFLAGYAMSLAAFSGLAFLPIEGAGDLTAHYNTHGAVLYARGRQAEALHFWERSSQMNGAYSSFADLSIAEHHFHCGDFRKALQRLESVPEGSPAAARKYAKKGDIFAAQKKVDDAIQAYEASLRINSGQRDVIRKLYRIYRRIDGEAARRMAAKASYIAAFQYDF